MFMPARLKSLDSECPVTDIF